MYRSMPITAPEKTGTDMDAEKKLLDFLGRAESFLAKIDKILPAPLAAPDPKAHLAWRFVRRDRQFPRLEPIRNLGLVRFVDLINVDVQKQKIQQNTLNFVQGRPANNVLLTGSRGTGKSSLVKACLEAYAHQGLRLVEVDKDHLVDLPEIVEVLAPLPEKFIIFCDDLSFESGEPGYKSLKSILDGSVFATTSNVLIYATSNRRHLLPEYMSENMAYRHTDDGEVHPAEGVEEKISLSERFGLWISFYPFGQNEYLSIVDQWLRFFQHPMTDLAKVHADALVWALERGSRSGRVAYQFAKDCVGHA